MEVLCLLVFTAVTFFVGYWSGQREGQHVGRLEGWNRAKYGIPYRNTPERQKFNATGWTFDTNNE